MTISRAGDLYRRLRLVRNAAVIAAKRLRHVPPTCSIHPTSSVSPDLRTGPYVFVGRRCTIPAGVRVGRYTMLASNVAIVGDDHDWSDPVVPMQFSGRPTQRSTEIGADVWLGHGVVVMRGLRIGDGAIVAAGSVVTHDVPAREIWAGVPARKLRDRFADRSDASRHVAMVVGSLVPPSFAERQQGRWARASTSAVAGRQRTLGTRFLRKAGT